MNAIKGLIMFWICVLIAYMSAVFAGAWVGMAYVSYVETTNLFLKKAQ